jgi:hypothetical protein
MTQPRARDPIYRRRRFEGEIIELCVRWYISYRLSYRDLVAMMAYMDAAPVSKRRVRSGIEVRLQSYIRPTFAECRSAWP